MTLTERTILFPPGWTMDMASELLRKHYKMGVSKWIPVVVTMPDGSQCETHAMQFTFFDQTTPCELVAGVMDMEITE